MKTFTMEGMEVFSSNKKWYPPYGKRVVWVPTKEYRAWSEKVKNNLDVNQDFIDCRSWLQENFIPTQHGIRVDILADFPVKLFWGENGIKKRGIIDVTNFEKCLVDILFEKRQYRNAFDIDDTYIVCCQSAKYPAAQHGITVRISLIDMRSFI